MSSRNTFHIIIQHDINCCKFGNIFQLLLYNFFFPNGRTFIKKKKSPRFKLWSSVYAIILISWWWWCGLEGDIIVDFTASGLPHILNILIFLSWLGLPSQIRILWISQINSIINLENIPKELIHGNVCIIQSLLIRTNIFIFFINDFSMWKNKEKSKLISTFKEYTVLFEMKVVIIISRQLMRSWVEIKKKSNAWHTWKLVLRNLVTLWRCPW